MSREMAGGKTDASEKSFHSISGDIKEDKKLLEPITCIFQVSGKEEKMQLIEAFNYWLQIPAEKLKAIIEIMHIFHTMDILLNNIENKTILRRGIPVPHYVYGIAHTLNAVNYTQIILMEKVVSLRHSEVMKIFVKQLLEYYKGQGTEIYWKHNYICPTEMEYKMMLIRKTAGFFDVIVQLMQLFSECKKDFKLLIETLGLYFQIRDDYRNLYGQEYSDNKDYCDDFSEGKFGFPIIHAIQNNSDHTELINFVKQRPRNIEIKNRCVDLLEKFNSFSYTRKVLEDLDKKARVEIELLGGNPLLMAVLDKWLNSIKNCNKGGVTTLTQRAPKL